MHPVEPSLDHTDITGLLHDWSAGNGDAAARVMPLVYNDLRRIAAGFARRERPDHTLQPTALVHEAYLQLFGDKPIEWKDRAHFLSTAARVMRHILVDYSRQRRAAKRGGAELKVSLSEDIEVSADVAARAVFPAGVSTALPDLVALDDALKSLAAIDSEEARLVELRFFGGLSLENTAECLGVSRKTVVRRWRRARAWLYAEMKDVYGHEGGER